MVNNFYLFSQQNLYQIYILCSFFCPYFFNSISCSREVTSAFFLATMQTIILIIKTVMIAMTNPLIGIVMNTVKWKQCDIIYYNSIQFLQLVLCNILSHSWVDVKLLDIVHKWQLSQYESSELEILVVPNEHFIMLQTK